MARLYKNLALLIESMKLLTSDLQSTAVEAIHELLLQNSYLDSAMPLSQFGIIQQ
ncbi:hypothetical protein [Fischerella sp. PCC 9605]|uniref:hypothetical protein n=1 Tax=Fischerella sp. PCC 9605 TaxID=1173024 RepID=UPI0004B595FF|nr:hypothetical protein [Fischerella sp. PCC 9605]